MTPEFPTGPPEERPDTTTISNADPQGPVGPVLTCGDEATAIVAALRARHPDLCVIDRGAYLRVLVPGRCELVRSRVEERLGRTFLIPRDLERVMPAFQGRLTMDEDSAQWSWGRIP